MRHLAAASAVAFAFVAVSARARADAPKVGDPMPWPSVKRWVADDPPEVGDAIGKVVIHWFCSGRVPECMDDLARVVDLRELGKVYVLAYIADAKTKKIAQRLDPIRDDVGAGGVAFGKDVDRLAATLGLPTGGSVVVDVNGKVALVAPSSEPDFLDKRDAKVRALVDSIKDYAVTQTGPSQVTVGDRFNLEVNVVLASWLSFNKRSPLDLTLTAPPNVACSTTKLTAATVRMDARTLTGTFSCVAGKTGSYEASAGVRFSYDSPNQGTGVGNDSMRWKFSAVAK